PLRSQHLVHQRLELRLLVLQDRLDLRLLIVRQVEAREGPAEAASEAEFAESSMAVGQGRRHRRGPARRPENPGDRGDDGGGPGSGTHGDLLGMPGATFTAPLIPAGARWERPVTRPARGATPGAAAGRITVLEPGPGTRRMIQENARRAWR